MSRFPSPTLAWLLMALMSGSSAWAQSPIAGNIAPAPDLDLNKDKPKHDDDAVPLQIEVSRVSSLIPTSTDYARGQFDVPAASQVSLLSRVPCTIYVSAPSGAGALQAPLLKIRVVALQSGEVLNGFSSWVAPTSVPQPIWKTFGAPPNDFLSPIFSFDVRVESIDNSVAGTSSAGLVFTAVPSGLANSSSARRFERGAFGARVSALRPRVRRSKSLPFVSLP